jgi:hypothetical protein
LRLKTMLYLVLEEEQGGQGNGNFQTLLFDKHDIQ